MQAHPFPEGQVCTGGTQIYMMVTDALLQTELSVLYAGLAQLKHKTVHNLGQQLCALSVFTQIFYVHGCLSTLDQWADLSAAYLPVCSPALVNHVGSTAPPHTVLCAHIDQCISHQPDATPSQLPVPSAEPATIECIIADVVN